MKKLMMIAVLAMSTVAVAVESTPIAVEQKPQQGQQQAKRRSTPEERRARREARVAAEGGLLPRPAKGKVVRILVKSDKVRKADIEAEARNMNRILATYVEVLESEGQSTNATGCLITLADMGEAPTLLCAPEDFWATVNVARLAQDNPNPDLLKSRVIKELWRALGYALGAPNQSKQTCLMRPIRNVADLDAEKISVLTPMPMMAVMQTAARLGFAKGGMTTYRTACMEGWAPSPTNDVQKALWESAHTLPSKPIQIKYDPKKDK